MERLKTFNQSVKENLPVVFCVKCGSTHLDQNFINELKCYNCDNSMKWDGILFSISRNKSEQDAITAFLKTAKGVKHGCKPDKIT